MRKRSSLVALAAVSGLLLAACGSTDDGGNTSTNAAAPASSADGSGGAAAPAPAGGDADLTTEISILAPSYADSSKADWEKIIAGFKTSYPNVTVTLQIEAWDGFTDKVNTRIQGNDMPDILNDNNFASSATGGILYPIDQVVSAETLAAIEPTLLKNGLGEDGVQWALPDISTARTMIYNTDLFDQAGITEPPTTWAEALEAATKIAALGDGISGYGLPLGKEEAQAEASLWIWGNNSNWFDGTTLAANSPANIEAFDEMKKFIDAGATQPDPGSSNRQQVADLFNQGKLGFYVTHPGLVKTLRTDFPNVKFDFAPIPSKDGKTEVAFGVTDFVLAFDNGDEDRKKATGAFLDYFYSEGVYSEWALGTGLLPATTADIAAQAEAEPENKPFFDALPTVQFLPQGNPQWTALQDALQANAGSVATSSAADTLNNIQEQVEAAG